MTKPMIAKLVRPGNQKFWTLQIINVVAVSMDGFVRALKSKQLDPAKPMIPAIKNGWVCVPFATEDKCAIIAAASSLANTLGLEVDEGEFQPSDFDCNAFIPAWLNAIMGNRERMVIYHPAARFLKEDRDGNRLPPHIQLIDSPEGEIIIDSQLKAVIS